MSYKQRSNERKKRLRDRKQRKEQEVHFLHEEDDIGIP